MRPRESPTEYRISIISPRSQEEREREREREVLCISSPLFLFHGRHLRIEGCINNNFIGMEYPALRDLRFAIIRTTTRINVLAVQNEKGNSIK
jgi:hypothetical protein